MENDNCGKYLTPKNQEFALIYEDELNYKKNYQGEIIG